MTNIQPVPEHLHTVTPRLIVHNGADAIEFYVTAFKAREIGERVIGPQGEVIHAEVSIGDSVVMITEDVDLAKTPTNSTVPRGDSVTAIMATYLSLIHISRRARRAPLHRHLGPRLRPGHDARDTRVALERRTARL